MKTAYCVVSAYNKDEASSLISSEKHELCEPELFRETVHDSEFASSFSCCYEDNSTYNVNPPLPSNLDDDFCYITIDVNTLPSNHLDYAKNSTTATTSDSSTSLTSATITDTSNLSIVFECQQEFDNDISVSIDFSPSPSFSAPQYLATIQHDQLDFTSQLRADVSKFPQYPADIMLPLMASHLQPAYEEDHLSSGPPFVHLNPQAASYSGLLASRGSLFPEHTNAELAAEYPGLLNRFISVGEIVHVKGLDYPGEDVGILGPNHLSSLRYSRCTQALSDENQQPASATPSRAEISATEKVAKLSVEERKEKIHRYMKKKSERNFNKKIKYACRKTLADSRPRVRGRFAKSDYFSFGHYKEDEYDEVTAKVDDFVDSTDMYASMGDFSSFNCSYPIQYWT
ncbi:hypothetical protein Droror1_Dr00000996 [Drosera rotundifolia]